jgi:hypothetical protein
MTARLLPQNLSATYSRAFTTPATGSTRGPPDLNATRRLHRKRCPAVNRRDSIASKASLMRWMYWFL